MRYRTITTGETPSLLEMASWSGAMRRAIAHGLTESEGESLIKGLQKATSHVAGIDEIMSKLPYQLEHGTVKVNKVEWSNLISDTRLGNMREFLTKINLPAALVKQVDEIALKNILKDIHPEFKSQAIEDVAARVKSVHPDLNVPMPKGGEAALAPATRTKIQSLYTNLKTAAKGAALVAGVFATIKFGPALWDSLNQAVIDRNGCWIMIKQPDGKVTACKVANRSCATQQDDQRACLPQVARELRGNAYYLVSRALRESDFAELTIKAEPKLKGVYEPGLSVDQILVKHGDILQQFIAANHPGIDDTDATAPNRHCDQDADKLEQKCIMCNPTAAPSSRHYVHAATLPPNMAYKCISNSTILDVLVDVADAAGADLWTGVGKVGDFLKKAITYLAVGTLCLGVLFLILRYFWRKAAAEGGEEAPPQYDFTTSTAAG